jgi:hypothetical protein
MEKYSLSVTHEKRRISEIKKWNLSGTHEKQRTLEMEKWSRDLGNNGSQFRYGRVCQKQSLLLSDDILNEISACILTVRKYLITVIYFLDAVTNFKSLDSANGRGYQALYRT